MELGTAWYRPGGLAISVVCFWGNAPGAKSRVRSFFSAEQRTESCVEAAIAGCLGLDFEYGKAVTTHMAMPLRFSVLKSVAEIRLEVDALDKLDDLLDTVEEAFNKRNAIVHHTWCRDPDTGRLFTVKETARARLETDLIPMTIDHVKRDALFVYNAGMALYSFLMEHDLLPPFPPSGRARGHKSKAARKKRREDMLRRAKS